MTEETFISGADGNEVFQAKYIPKQKPPTTADHPSMKAYISTFPALGQVTQIDKYTTVFTALLEIDESRASDPWQLSLWHSEGKEWREVPMDPSRTASSHPAALQKPNTHFGSALTKLYFTTPLAIHLPTNFTIKFRSSSDQSWKWVRDHQGTQDGILMLKSVTSQDALSSELGDYVEGLNSELRAKNYRSQSPGTTLWSVEASIAAAEGEKSSFKDIKFGLPWGKGKFLRWFALIRIWSPWLAPRQGKSTFGLDKEAVMCSFLSVTGKHLVLMGISGVGDVMTLFTNDSDGNVVLRIRNDSPDDTVGRVLVGLGDDFESANAAVMYHARDIVAAGPTASAQQQKEIAAMNEGNESTKVWAENWYDGLTYCTWNALGQRLTEDKVVKAAEVLKENNINVTNFIIDDNWQAIDYRGHGQFQHGWDEFEAEREAFPNGLKGVVTKIREKLPSVQHIAVWHAILGYWGGLAPEGKIAKTYKTIEVIREDGQRRNLPLGGTMTVVDKEDVSKFYDDFYSFLASCGVDAVKTDAQFMLDTFVSAKDRRDLIPTYLDAWTVSTLRHFSVKAISCMSQTPQILFHSQLPQNKPPVLVRNSDDFFPEIPTSHPWHIFTNAHNALFTQHLNLIPDWDMFQTVHDYSGFHAAARCVSGGPIYITDVPGEHDLDLIGQMTGPTVRGKTVIFRPSIVGKSLDAYNGYDDDQLLLVGTYHGAAVTGTGIIGFFNVSGRPLSELIPLSRFPGVVEAQYYVVRAHSSGLVTRPLQVVDASALIHVSLGIRGYDILSSYPLRGFVDEKKNETTWIANLGLLGKMAGAAAVVDNKITKLETGKIVLDTNLKALGVLGIYISTLPTISWKDKLMITILGKPIPVDTIAISETDEHVLNIDVETAWKELELKAGWSNEVEVKIYINPTH
ncbi:putative galactinol--sucrose galactosyltransferase [Lachnellula occidentalis]|uniref:Putative galactinol--sucrose galactosyltransferase n=1 Tax=Lachnellula occidentalis TaxID=215460 RepID=A0A8H8RN25_9HELO|nr:putative galactinol--sucrose galactosyltransferase [Lachnellula occidentalis]